MDDFVAEDISAVEDTHSTNTLQELEEHFNVDGKHAAPEVSSNFENENGLEHSQIEGVAQITSEDVVETEISEDQSNLNCLKDINIDNGLTAGQYVHTEAVPEHLDQGLVENSSVDETHEEYEDSKEDEDVALHSASQNTEDALESADPVSDVHQEEVANGEELISAPVDEIHEECDNSKADNSVEVTSASEKVVGTPENADHIVHEEAANNETEISATTLPADATHDDSKKDENIVHQEIDANDEELISAKTACTDETEQCDDSILLDERSSPEGMSDELETVPVQQNKETTDKSQNIPADGSNDVKEPINVSKSPSEEISATGNTAEDKAEKKQKEEWLDILGNNLLKKKVTCEGKGEDTRPTVGSEVTLRMSGELQNGTKLREEKLVFILDEREVIQALDLAVALMEREEKALLYTDAKYAYGPFGCKENGVVIPPNCSITYELELVSVTDSKNLEKLTDDERISIGDRKRIRGNGFYTRGDFGGAIDCYKIAVKYLEGSASEKVNDMLLKCQNNLSASQIKVNAFQAALQSCNKVLNLQPENVKALFRKGRCLEKIGEAEEALKWMKKASMLDPTSKVIQTELLRINDYVKKNQQNESAMYKRMVDGLKKGQAETLVEDSSFSMPILVGTMIVAGIGILAGFMWYKH